MAGDKKSGAKKAKKTIKAGDRIDAKAKTKKARRADGAERPKAKARDRGGLESLAKLAESPLVADLIAVGATAAVAAIASSRSKGAAGGKNAAKAAASAIGARLMTEFNAIKDNAKNGPKAAKPD